MTIDFSKYKLLFLAVLQKSDEAYEWTHDYIVLRNAKGGQILTKEEIEQL